jgi:hypothetical protein
MDSSGEHRRTRQKNLAFDGAQGQFLSFWVYLGGAAVVVGLIVWLAFSTHDPQARNLFTAVILFFGIVLSVVVLLLAMKGGFERLMYRTFNKLHWFEVPEELQQRSHLSEIRPPQGPSRLLIACIRAIRAATALRWVFLAVLLCTGMVLAIVAVIALFSSQLH